MENGKIDIKSYNLEELTEFVTQELGEKSYRAKQIYQWLHQKQAGSFEEMTNISKAMIATLKEQCALVCLEKVDVKVSGIDGTRKYIFRLPDGNVIESVLMRYQFGNSACISTQVGCKMGCRFCASAEGGLVRSLTASEMLDQVYQIGKDIGERVSHVVVMGMGEPLDNYRNLVRFLRMLTDQDGLNLSQRNVTVSTCGIAPRMRELADEGIPATLALSLHAADKKKRRELMPVAGRYNLREVIDACAYYFAKTGRRVTIEYILLAGVNDGEEDAAALVELLDGMNCHVNLIPANYVKERGFRAPDGKVAADFKNKLEKNGIHVTIRREMGRDIAGACGQLRRGFMA